MKVCIGHDTLSCKSVCLYFFRRCAGLLYVLYRAIDRKVPADKNDQETGSDRGHAVEVR